MKHQSKDGKRKSPALPTPRRRPGPPKGTFDFGEKDVGALVAALGVVPELQISAAAVKGARAAKVRYPIKSFRSVARLLPQKVIHTHGHQLSAAHAKHYMTKELFPIEDETGLARAVYLALLRCNASFAWAQQAPENATAVLSEYQKLTRELRRP